MTSLRVTIITGKKRLRFTPIFLKLNPMCKYFRPEFRCLVSSCLQVKTLDIKNTVPLIRQQTQNEQILLIRT